MKEARPIIILVAALASVLIAGCSAVTSAPANALAFSGTYAGALSKGDITSRASITVARTGSLSASLTNCPAAGYTSSFSRTAHLTSSTSGSADVVVSTTNGRNSVSSTAQVAFTYCGGLLTFSITDNALGGTMNIIAT